MVFKAKSGEHLCRGGYEASKAAQIAQKIWVFPSWETSLDSRDIIFMNCPRHQGQPIFNTV